MILWQAIALGVVIGAAFGAVVAALVKDLLTPLIAAIVGKPDFSQLEFTVNGSKFAIGEFINAVPAPERWGVDRVAYEEGTYSSAVRLIVSDALEAAFVFTHCVSPR